MSRKLNNSSMLLINLYAVNFRCLEIKNVRFGSVSVIKVCNHNGRYSIEVQAQSLFQDQTISWIRIVNGIDKCVREAMPIQEEDKASGKPATKARPILKPSSISDVNSIPAGQREWIDTETREFNDPYCFQVSKIHHSITKTQSGSLSRS